MRLVEEVRSGRIGLCYLIPHPLEVTDESPACAMLVDRERGLGWMLGHFDLRPDLSSEHESLLKADIERHTRDLVDQSFRRDRPRGRGPWAAKPPRTAHA